MEKRSAHLHAPRRDDFTREQAEQFVTEAVALAMTRDASSGGCIRMVTLNEEGAHHRYIQGDQVRRGAAGQGRAPRGQGIHAAAAQGGLVCSGQRLVAGPAGSGDDGEWRTLFEPRPWRAGIRCRSPRPPRRVRRVACLACIPHSLPASHAGAQRGSQ